MRISKREFLTAASGAVLAVARAASVDAETTDGGVASASDEAGSPAGPHVFNRRYGKVVVMEQQDVDTRTISVEHVTIRSKKAFDQVRTKLEALLPRIDDGIFILLRYGEAERALRELEALPSLTIFSSRNHGALLAVAGLQRRSMQYDIGNPLTASKMTRHQISAGLYAPVRVLLRENANGEVAFEYDRPLSVFGQFQDAAVDSIARQLDEDLRAALQQAAS